MSKANDQAKGRTPADRSVAPYPINSDGTNHTLTPIGKDEAATLSPTQPLKPMREDTIATGGTLPAAVQ